MEKLLASYMDELMGCVNSALVGDASAAGPLPCARRAGGLLGHEQQRKADKPVVEAEAAA